jgi:hypothetical protein
MFVLAMKQKTQKIVSALGLKLVRSMNSVCPVMRISAKDRKRNTTVPRDIQLENDSSSRRERVMPWEFHQRSQDLALPWAKGESGEARINRQRRQQILA